MEMQFSTPILLIAFNRPDATREVFEAIAAQQPTRLFIACDGPRLNNETDNEKCRLVKEIFENISWTCEVKKLYHDENLGCSYGPRNAINWFFSHVEAGIILEDDCLPTYDFFSYCENLLDYYKNDDKILNICGSNMGYNKPDSSGYFYSRFMNMNGWATWRRSAKEIDYELKSWKKIRYPLWRSYIILRQGIFDADINWYKYWREKFDKTIVTKDISWWDWQWIYYQLCEKKLSIIPNQNLVTNIGFNAFGTHTKDPNNPLANIPTGTLKFPLSHNDNKKPDFSYEEYAVKWVWCYHKRLSKLFYIKNFVSRIIGRS
jgi:hypothetical protein